MHHVFRLPPLNAAPKARHTHRMPRVPYFKLRAVVLSVPRLNYFYIHIPSHLAGGTYSLSEYLDKTLAKMLLLVKEVFMETKFHVTFYADGWPAKKIMMQELLFGPMPKDNTAPKILDDYPELQEIFIKLRRRVFPITKWRVESYKFIKTQICKVRGHRYDTPEDRKFSVCARCVTFTKDPDLLPTQEKKK